MNKIVVVGHPASGHEEVFSLLRRWGMAAALPSRRDGLLPQAITATLCKAHKVAPLDSVTDEGEFSQIEAAPVWQGMALDLMLGNLEQPLWGWTDPQTIYALDYWEGLGPHLTFVLVYDEPHRLLMSARSQGGEGGSPALQDLRRLLDNWLAYNGALLRFHLRHPGRSLLVHGQQVQRATDRCAEQLQPLLDTPLSAVSEAAALPGPQEEGQRSALMSLPQELNSALSAGGGEPEEAMALLQADATERYIVDDLLARHPDVMQLYSELQSVANLPLDAPPREAHGAAAEAWQALMRQREFVTGLMLRLYGQMQRANEEVSRNQLALQKEAQAQEELEAELAKLNGLGADNELLLAQLHRVQQELEQYYIRLNSLSKDKELLLRELEQAQRDRRRCRRQLEEVRRGKAESDGALDEASRQVAALESRVVAVQSELQARLGQAPDLSIVYSRTLATTLMRRLLSKVAPKYRKR